MNISIYHHASLPHQIEWGNSFAKGLERHGIKPIIREYHSRAVVDDELAVFWGHGFRNELIREQQIKAGRHYLVMERGFFNDRFLHTSLGFDGFNGQACFLNHSSPSDRWVASRTTLKDWCVEGEYYLLIGQIIGDNSCSNVDLKEWYRQVVESSDKPILFRPNPRPGYQKYIPSGVTLSSGTLEQDMGGAIAVITFSSTVGVDALLAGKPTVAYDPISMVYDIVPHRIQLTSLIEPDREQWAYDLAYTQWSKGEIEAGLAWEHLRGMYDENS